MFLVGNFDGCFCHMNTGVFDEIHIQKKHLNWGGCPKGLGNFFLIIQNDGDRLIFSTPIQSIILL